MRMPEVAIIGRLPTAATVKLLDLVKACDLKSLGNILILMKSSGKEPSALELATVEYLLQPLSLERNQPLAVNFLEILLKSLFLML